MGRMWIWDIFTENYSVEGKIMATCFDESSGWLTEHDKEFQWQKGNNIGKVFWGGSKKF